MEAIYQDYIDGNGKIIDNLMTLSIAIADEKAHRLMPNNTSMIVISFSLENRVP